MQAQLQLGRAQTWPTRLHTRYSSAGPGKLGVGVFPNTPFTCAASSATSSESAIRGDSSRSSTSESRPKSNTTSMGDVLVSSRLTCWSSAFNATSLMRLMRVVICWCASRELPVFTSFSSAALSCADASPALSGSPAPSRGTLPPASSGDATSPCAASSSSSSSCPMARTIFKTSFLFFRIQHAKMETKTAAITAGRTATPNGATTRVLEKDVPAVISQGR
mmetsp:Transcript_4510/g.9790  ORF Transcript_4510/g.9790 Transcript_4510/m.9790 type:complete len:221 (+) Transcript_4510:124-786(+)